ncbi:hypothetical protein [Companilactobacillus farciminis]|nr:hypothetical protein [Companilactobacillus farciminis]ATO45787.1 hypothetical protein LF20184_03000 [Companilactobacillus farciminis KCTC 3681 = DSM 20184]
MKRLTSGNWVFMLDMGNVDLLQHCSQPNFFATLTHGNIENQEVHIANFDDQLRDEILHDIEIISRIKDEEELKKHFIYLTKQVITHAIGIFDD